MRIGFIGRRISCIFAGLLRDELLREQTTEKNRNKTEQCGEMYFHYVNNEHLGVYLVAGERDHRPNGGSTLYSLFV